MFSHSTHLFFTHQQHGLATLQVVVDYDAMLVASCCCLLFDEQPAAIAVFELPPRGWNAPACPVCFDMSGAHEQIRQRILEEAEGRGS